MISQRVVGFVVLIAIAVIFWPIVFVVPETEENVELPVLEMPPRPQIVISERREPDLQKVDASSLPKFPMSAPRSEQSSDELSLSTISTRGPLVEADFKPSQHTLPPERASFDEQGLPIGWLLQIATFSDSSRANELSALLRSKGYKAYVEAHNGTNELHFRVMIGPHLQMVRVMEMKSVLDQYFSIDSIVVQFQP